MAPKRSGWNPRAVTAPVAAFVMAGLLYTYSVTSIRAAKRNARLHREADGGQLDMRRESLRRHGVLDQVEGTGGVELFRDAGAEEKNESRFLTENKAKPLGSEQKEETGAPRTQNEGVLDTYRGRRGLKKLKEEHPQQ
ncbi:hypothetical protein A1O1_06422 [Capronia coronata CBS 617.96]|uniref:Uncharacterized protein n=1 Tax=Capronia coronata CBS 617.96 TaxID=1182541 RepID=W9Y0P2_9EURO|nr:uncharacterized protein A1O1_06422 [Capronia coronata CBS 617.96]EXJ86053.1 hypothetical protein A1O1_06422 [Capronia coronata CBS 617.96]